MYTRETPVPAKATRAKPRSLLKLDQAYITVGGREHFTLVRETDIMRTIALRISPRDAEVPSSTQSAPYVSPVGTNQDAHRIDSRIPLGPRSYLDPRAAELPICSMYPHVAIRPISANGRETSPRIPLPPYVPPGRATDGSADCLSLHTLVDGSRPLNRWGQAALPSLP